MDVLTLFVAGIAVAALLLFLCVVLVNASPRPVIHRLNTEKTFYDPKTDSNHEFPFDRTQHSVHLSVVVPAFDEEKRLPPMLDEALAFLSKREKTVKGFSFEVIVVSDGSRDRTVSVALDYVKKWGSERVRVLDLKKNRGKGGAVRLGVLSARGAVVLFADADGATKFADIEKLEANLETIVQMNYMSDPGQVAGKHAVVVGSRSHLEEESLATRSIFRTFLMRGFHFLVWSLAVRTIRDTQCGFKLLTRSSARVLFKNVHVERWAFDVELLYLTELFKIPTKEVAVCWTEIDGSKIVPVFSWVQMGRDVFLIWFKYLIGAWKITQRPNL